MAKTGRPQIEINFELLAKLCERPITAEDVAYLMDISKDTLERAIKRKFKLTFAAYKDKKAAHFRLSIHEQQYKILKKGNVTMAIWLGKQYLNQKDKHEISNDEIKPFTLAYSVKDLKKKDEK